MQAYVDEELRLADGSRLLDPPHVIHGKSGVMASFNRKIDAFLNSIDEFYARALRLALAHRPTEFATGFGVGHDLRQCHFHSERERQCHRHSVQRSVFQPHSRLP